MLSSSRIVPDGAIMLYCDIHIERFPHLQDACVLGLLLPVMLFWLDFPIYNTQEKDELEHLSKGAFRKSIHDSIFFSQKSVGFSSLHVVQFSFLFCPLILQNLLARQSNLMQNGVSRGVESLSIHQIAVTVLGPLLAEGLQHHRYHRL